MANTPAFIFISLANFFFLSDLLVLLLQANVPLSQPGYRGQSILSNPIVISVAEKLQKMLVQVALLRRFQVGQSVLPKSANETRIKERVQHI